MVPITVSTLIISSAPGPSILVLQPIEDSTPEGKLRVVPIWMGANEATQISVALNKTKFNRPMTHDLMLDALTNLDAQVDHVVINDAKGAMFFARLSLRQHGRLIDLDARPSDAISLALRQHAPLFIEDDVLDKLSFPYIKKDTMDPSSIQQEISEFHAFIESINPEDFSMS